MHDTRTSTLTGLSLGIRRRSFLLAGVATFLAGYCIAVYGGLVESKAAEWWTNMAWTIASLATALRCFATARAGRTPSRRNAWWLFGTGALVWFAGMLWWDFRYLIQGAEFVYPYGYDMLFMSFPIFMVAGTFFEPLFSTRGSGVGRGMTIVKQVLESHGGEIPVESK